MVGRWDRWLSLDGAIYRAPTVLIILHYFRSFLQLCLRLQIALITFFHVLENADRKYIFIHSTFSHCEFREVLLSCFLQTIRRQRMLCLWSKKSIKSINQWHNLMQTKTLLYWWHPVGQVRLEGDLSKVCPIQSISYGSATYVVPSPVVGRSVVVNVDWNFPELPPIYVFVIETESDLHHVGSMAVVRVRDTWLIFWSRILRSYRQCSVENCEG